MMDDKKKMVPRIRFRGFGDAWEQRKLNDFLIESQIKGSNGSTSQKLTVKLWGKGIVPKVNNWKKGSENTKYYVRHAGQLMYGKLDFLHGAFGIVPKSLDGFESTVDSPAFDISKKINSSFLLYLVMQRKFYIKQGSIANGSRKAKRVHENTFLDMSIQLPKVEEQGKIGQLLGTIDNLIVANEKKGQQLKGLKRLLMEKIFSQVWRFRGFSDPWEQRKLKDLSTDIGTGKSIFSKLSKSNINDYKVLGSTSIIGHSDDFDYEGNFILTARVGANAGNIYRESGKVKISDNTVFIKAIQSDFLYYVLMNFNLKRLSFGTGQPLIKSSELKNLKLQVSVSDSERKKLGLLFVTTDNLIVANEKKLDQLKQLKKYLMQNMFV